MRAEAVKSTALSYLSAIDFLGTTLDRILAEGAYAAIEQMLPLEAPPRSNRTKEECRRREEKERECR